ncbi:post-COAP-1 domain-containing protein [Thermoproteota archaeon]
MYRISFFGISMIVILLSSFLAATSVYAIETSVEVSSDWKINDVTIDGKLTGVDEWSETQPVDMNIYTRDGTTSVPATFWFMNDGEWYYQLTKVEWPAFDVDFSYDGGAIIYLWDDKSDLGVAGLIGVDEYFDFAISEYGILDTDAGGVNNVVGGGMYDGTHYWFEFKKELEAGDDYDWNLIPGETYGQGPDYLEIGLWDNSTVTWYGRQIVLTLAPLGRLEVSSDWKINDVTIDGKMMGSEWSEAQPVDVMLYEFDGTINLPSTYWVMNDDEWLYQLVRIEWDASDVDLEPFNYPEILLEGDHASIAYFWNAYASSDAGTSSGSDLNQWEPPLLSNWHYDLADGGENNVEGAATHDGTYYWLEFKKELDSGDGYDWSMVPGQTYGQDPDQLSIGLWDNSALKYYGRDLVLTLAVNTPEGTGVIVEPEDDTTGTNPVTMTFSSVTDEGVTSLTSSDVGTEPPTGFLLGDPATYYDLTTTASYSGSIEICIDYTGISYGNELNLGLFHYEDTDEDGIADTWVDRTSSLDTTNNIICATIDSLSPFSVFELDSVPPTITVGVPVEWGIYAADSGTEYDFSATDFIDPDPVVTGTQIDYYGNPISVSTGDLLPTISGVYTLTITATDDAGNVAEESVMFVIYDPSAGFVTGGGWIVPEPELGDNHANFGFVAKYKKGSDTPDGNLEFQYQYRDINLKSTEIDWLAIPANSAMFQGTATINGEGLYTFRVDATDGDLTGGQPDHFKIKVWEGTDTEADPINDYKGDLAGGNIKVHKKNK